MVCEMSVIVGQTVGSGVALLGLSGGRTTYVDALDVPEALLDGLPCGAVGGDAADAAQEEAKVVDRGRNLHAAAVEHALARHRSRRRDREKCQVKATERGAGMSQMEATEKGVESGKLTHVVEVPDGLDGAVVVRVLDEAIPGCFNIVRQTLSGVSPKWCGHD